VTANFFRREPQSPRVHSTHCKSPIGKKKFRHTLKAGAWSGMLRLPDRRGLPIHGNKAALRGVHSIRPRGGLHLDFAERTENRAEGSDDVLTEIGAEVLGIDTFDIGCSPVTRTLAWWTWDRISSRVTLMAGKGNAAFEAAGNRKSNSLPIAAWRKN